MKYLRNSILLIGILLLTLSCCKEDEPTVEQKGSIYVTVVFQGQVIAGAQISTEPATEIVTTDITGTAIISNVPIGGYKVNAFKQGVGSGSTSVTVPENEVREVAIYLIEGVFENPQVKIESPIDLSSHNIGDEISFSAIVSDEQDTPNTLSLEWSSDRDGVLNTDPANSDGIASFSTNALSEGKHVITLKVKDSDDYESTDQVTIEIKKLPDATTLNPIEIVSNGLKLTWSASSDPDFSKYRILKSENSSDSFEVIDVITDVNTLSFTDTNVYFNTRYYYRVAVVINNGDESFSNTESKLFEGENIDLGVNIVRMIIDPERPYIYALDRINNSLLFINKDTKTVEKTIFAGSKPSDIDISLDNSKAYVANYGSNQIAVVDLETQEIVNNLFVEVGTWDGGNPYRLACLADDKIVFVSENQWVNIKLVSAINGSTISTVLGNAYYPGLLTNSSGTIVFVTESGSSGSEIIRYDLTGDMLNKVDQSDAGSANGLRDGSISGNDTYIFHLGSKYLTHNLSTKLGSFSEKIIDCNYDGSIAIGEEYIWDAETFSIIKPLPVSSSILRLDNDDNTIYIYDNNTSKIYITTIN